MRTIETFVHVGKDHTVNIRLKLPDEVVPGDYNVLLVMDNKGRELKAAKAFECLSWNWDARPESCSFRREDIYGDDGR